MLGDDHALILSGVHSLLATNFEVVGQETDGKALVEAATRLQPEIVILDISMPSLNGFEAARQIKQYAPDTILIFLSQHLSPAYLNTALQIGAKGYVLKTETTSELENALKSALKGDVYISPRFGDDVLSRYRSRTGGIGRQMGELTERQRQILQLIVQGNANKEIADRLNVSIKTVEFHRAKIMSKLGAKSAAELTRLAIKQGVVPE